MHTEEHGRRWLKSIPNTVSVDRVTLAPSIKDKTQHTTTLLRLKHGLSKDSALNASRDSRLDKEEFFVDRSVNVSAKEDKL